ncbi:MAG: SDR family oxidoreductase [bacterium]|nr:SDR family oxidoreductase [bacterium]
MTFGTIRKFDLEGDLAVITGGAGFLGKKHAEAILDGNGRVVLLDINDKAIGKALQYFPFSYPRKVWGYTLDITKEKEVTRVISRIIREIGSISILINNAANNPVVEGGGKNLSRLENMPIEAWNKDFAVSVTGALIMSRVIGQHMARNKRGVILNIASDLAIIAPDQRIYQKEGDKPGEHQVKPVSYSVIKHALIGLTKYLATYWADQGVRVNAISPAGIYNTGLEDDFVQRLTNLIPMGRMANGDEYKAAILFLCSNASAYMTGANLVIDGGRTCW